MIVISRTLAVACWIWALKQSRMIFIYRRKIDSPTTGLFRGDKPNVVMSSIATRSAITFTIFGVLLLVVPWPQVLTYISGTWVCRAVIDAVLCWLGRGQYTVTVAVMNSKGRRYYLFEESAKVIGNGLWFGACIYFIGF